MPIDPQLPAVEIPDPDSPAQQEQDEFASQGKRLDLSLRKWAGRGALLISLGLYLEGACLAVRYAMAVPIGMQLPSWHVVVASLVALFAIPTVLVLAVLRSASLMAKGTETDSVHALVGTKIMNLVDKLLDKLVDGVAKRN